MKIFVVIVFMCLFIVGEALAIEPVGTIGKGYTAPAYSPS